MSNFLMLLVCLIAGMALRRSGRLPDQAHGVVNTIILHVSLPAVTVRYLHDFHFDRDQLLPVLMPWLLFLIGAAIVPETIGKLDQAPAAH